MRVHHDVSHYPPAFALGVGQPRGRERRQPDIGGRTHAPLRAHSPRSHVKLALAAVSDVLHCPGPRPVQRPRTESQWQTKTTTGTETTVRNPSHDFLPSPNPSRPPRSSSRSLCNRVIAAT